MTESPTESKQPRADERGSYPPRAADPTKVFLVGVALPEQPLAVVEEHLDELERLVESAGSRVVGRALQNRRAPDPATFLGRGKAEQVGLAASELGAGLLVFDDDLAPSQAKNLEEVTKLRVLDRSGVILEIFRRRARTREARTQVELAHLRYQLPRLTRQWSHLSRQQGGRGGRGGEGEQQLEQDRRILKRQIGRLERDLEQIERTRELHRRGRKSIPEIALAGYTNAGKSTLFNRLTRAGALAEDLLFATLDAKLRRGQLEGYGPVVFADTVGFIRKLPHHLVSSFRSTLGEVAAADLVVHLVDRSHPSWREQMQVADQVLEELGVEASRVLHAFNKVDRIDPEEPFAPEEHGAIHLSAATGEGVGDLIAALRARLAQVRPSTHSSSHPVFAQVPSS